MRRPPISHREMQRYLERARQERAETIAKLLRRGAAHGASAFRAAAGWAFRLARTTVAAFARWRWQRATARELGALDDRALKDIGLRRSDIDHVAAQVAASPERRLDRSAPPAAWDAAHALRTPLTSIRSFSEILRDNPDLPRVTRERFLGIVIAESERLDLAIGRMLGDRPAA